MTNYEKCKKCSHSIEYHYIRLPNTQNPDGSIILGTKTLNIGACAYNKAHSSNDTCTCTMFETI